MSVVIRRARPDESDAIAALYRRTAEREWPFLCPHTPAEDRALFCTAFEKGPIWVAEAGGAVVGFCAARRGWIDHLYVAHERHGEGIGQALLRRTLKGRTHVRLWTFQCNARSRAFYRRQGFAEALFTDGAGNEEKEPDVMLAWRRRDAAPADGAADGTSPHPRSRPAGPLPTLSLSAAAFAAARGRGGGCLSS